MSAPLDGVVVSSGTEAFVLSGDRESLASILDVESDASALARANALCVLCMKVADVSGVALTIGGASGTSMVCSTGLVSTRLDDLQFDLGEGPITAALGHGQTVRAPDLADIADQRWPWFAPAAVHAGARGIFVLPLWPGHASVAALTLFRSTPGPLTLQQAQDAQGISTGAALILAFGDHCSAEEPGGWACGDGSGFRPQIHQAVGVTMGFLDIDAAAALDLLRAHAYLHDQPLDQVGHDILAGRLMLDTDAA